MSGCDRFAVPVDAPSPETGVFRVGRPVMGTVLQVMVRAEDAVAAQQAAEQAVLLAEHWEDVLTTWRDFGELARLNREAGGGWQAISPDLALALDQMLWFSRASGGAFDPAVGALVKSLRHGSPRDTQRRSPISEALVRRPGEALLESGVEVDAGGIGKGLALDRMALLLRSKGVAAAVLDFGGSSQLGFGTFDGESPLMLVAALRAGEVHGVVELDGQALSTSRSPAPRGAGPIVDPRTGRIVSVHRMATVTATSATAAEAWSTALIVLGRRGISHAAEHGVEVLFEDQDGVVWTPGFPLRRSEP